MNSFLRTNRSFFVVQLTIIQLSDEFTDLFTACAAWSELVLVAGHTVVFVLVRDEGLGADWLLTAVADETALVPRGPTVLQLSST